MSNVCCDERCEKEVRLPSLYDTSCERMLREAQEKCGNDNQTKFYYMYAENAHAAPKMHTALFGKGRDCTVTLGHTGETHSGEKDEVAFAERFVGRRAFVADARPGVYVLYDLTSHTSAT